MDSIVNDLIELFADTVTVEPFLAKDRYGNASYQAPFECKARVIGRTRVATDTDGQERVSNVQVMLAGAFGVSVQDRFTLPERFSVKPGDADPKYRQPEPIAVDQETDENGAHHETIYFAPSPRNRGF